MQASRASTSAGAARRTRVWLLMGAVAVVGVTVAIAIVLVPRSDDSAADGFEPRVIRVSADLKPGDAVPASAGALAGCNLLLVTFDTTRADRIGCYGNPDIETPTLDGLAAGGVLFSRALAPAPVTLPSHASILTGLYPFHHGARANTLSRLDDGQRTLAEILSAEGYATGAAVSAFVLSTQFGIDQGFGFFDDDLDDSGDERALLVAHRSADKTTQRAQAWLRRSAADKFFLWVHYYDPHFPRDPPQAFLDRNKLPYDAEISFADDQLGSLLKAIDDLGVADRTLVVVAGDHGEGLGQHQEATHAALIYDSTIRVPLIMRCGDRLGGGVHVDRWVSLVDVMPTVLSLLGVPAPDGLDGVDLTVPSSETRPLYVETLEVLFAYGWASLLGVYEGSSKYIYGPRVELYDLDRDPFEEHDLAESSPQVASAMNQRLESLYGDDLVASASAQPAGQITAEALEKLAALGYLGSVSGQIPPPAARPHPSTVMPLMQQTFAAIALEQDYGMDAAISQLEAIVREHPDFVAGHQHLGEAYVKAGRLDDADAEFAACLRLRPGQLKQVLSLARLKVRQKKAAEAIVLYRQMLERVPDHFGALNELGRTLVSQGDYREAVEVLGRALRSRPRDRALPEMLSRAARIAGAEDPAVAMLSALLATEPNLPMARNALAGMMADQAQYAAAVTLLREGIDLAPREHELINNLAVILATCNDASVRRPDEAAALMEQVCADTAWTDPRYMHTLSLVYASALRFDDAVDMASRAQRVASASSEPRFVQLAPAIGRALQQYRLLQERQSISAASQEQGGERAASHDGVQPGAGDG